VFGSSGLESILLKTGFQYAQVPFKAGLTVFETIKNGIYEVWNFNSGNYLFTTDTK